jgi:hypothetical protein
MVTSWTDTVAQHPTVVLISQLAENLPTALDTAKSPAAIDHIRRLKAVVTSLEQALRRPEFITLAGLESSNHHLNNTLQEVLGYVSDGDEGRLPRMNSSLDQVLIEMPYRVPLPRRESQTLLDESYEFAETVKRLHIDYQEHAEQLTAQIEAATEQLNDAVTGFNQRLTDLTSQSELEQQSIHTDATSRIEDLRNEIETLKQRLDTIIEQQQQTFLQAESARTKDFSDSLTKLGTDFQEKLGLLTTATRDKLIEVEQRGEAATVALEGYHEEARNIVAIRAAAGVAGSYLNVAKEQLKQANFWRWVALLLLIAVFASVVFTSIVSPLSNEDISTEDFVEYGLTRVPIVLALAGLWGYAARESNRHRRREADAERLATELTSLRPFLAELNLEKRNELIEKATSRYFKGHEIISNHDG